MAEDHSYQLNTNNSVYHHLQNTCDEVRVELMPVHCKTFKDKDGSC